MKRICHYICFGVIFFWCFSISHSKDVLANDLEYSFSIRTDELGISLFADDNGYLPSLKSGNYEKWIDRIDVSEYALDFYTSMEEAADNDGKSDFLINMDTSSTLETIEISEQDENGVNRDVEALAIKVTSIYGEGRNYSEALENCQEDFYYKYYQTSSAYAAFERDHPEVFWLDNSCYIAAPPVEGALVSNGDGTYKAVYRGDLYFILKSPTFNIKHEKYTDDGFVVSTISELNSCVDNILCSVSEMDDVNKIKYFNEWLTKNNEYNTHISNNTDSIENILVYAPDVFECTAALFGSIGENGPVCESYARAFKVLCDRVSIPCVLVNGQALTNPNSTGVGHMWNYVEVKGAWYGVDVTWNDPTGGSEGAISGYENETFLLVGAEDFVGNASMTFINSHPAENLVYSNGVAFTNGPILSSKGFESEDSIDIVFSDVGADMYCYDPVIWAVSEGITSGYTNTLFAPDEMCTRGQVVTFLWRAAGKPESNIVNPFIDVKESDYFYHAVLWAVENNITSGMSKSIFAPEEMCTRGQVVTFLWRATGEPDVLAANPFIDLKENEYYCDAVLWAVDNGITSGLTSVIFGPEEVCTRGQVVTFLYRNR